MMTIWVRRAAFAVLLVTLSACGGGEEGSGGSSGGGGTGGGTAGAPTISGTPKSSVKENEAYLFEPNASDPNGDALNFTISNKPSWANFDQTTGRLSGTPGSADVGTYSNIRITVSDGNNTATLGPFSITVTQFGTGSATLSWNSPTSNEDGSALDDLAGFRIYYGTTEGSYPSMVPVTNPGLTTFVVDNLSPDTYFFVVTAYDTSGNESDRSNVASKTVTQ